MRYAILLILGVFIGALGAVAGISALRQGTPYNDAIMAVLKQQMGAMHGMREKNQCSAEEINRRLSFMALAASEVDAAFLPVGDDDKFKGFSADLREAIAKAQSANATTCDALGQATSGIGGTCKACHEVFR